LRSLTGQTAFVTGASRGLGGAIALRLAEAGMRIGLAARSAEALEALADEIRQSGGEALAVACDVTRYDSVENAMRRLREVFGPVDVLVNNAGLGWYRPFEEWSVEEIDLALDVNLKGTVYATKAALPDLLANGGQVIVVASDLARKPLANMAVYAAAKHGVLGFAHSLLREVRGRGVRVMTLTPGIIDTYFGGGEPGRDPAWSLRPELVADLVLHLLTLPPGVVLDEVAIHPLGQDF
jgi:3-oxoacyl-[acyl-carrier protein] reductase